LRFKAISKNHKILYEWLLKNRLYGKIKANFEGAVRPFFAVGKNFQGIQIKKDKLSP